MWLKSIPDIDFKGIVQFACTYMYIFTEYIFPFVVNSIKSCLAWLFILLFCDYFVPYIAYLYRSVFTLSIDDLVNFVISVFRSYFLVCLLIWIVSVWGNHFPYFSRIAHYVYRTIWQPIRHMHLKL
jgi:hypothetical protein